MPNQLRVSTTRTHFANVLSTCALIRSLRKSATLRYRSVVSKFEWPRQTYSVRADMPDS